MLAPKRVGLGGANNPKKMSAEKKSISEYFYEPGGVEGHKCGYCKSTDTSISQGMWTHCLTDEDYQDLIDRGWRWSGKYCYKPALSSTCCPLYAISCHATTFRLSKSQKAVLKKVAKYLVEGVDPRMTEKLEEAVEKAASTTTASKKPLQLGKGADPSKPPCRKAKVVRKELKDKKKLASSCVNAPGMVEGKKENMQLRSPKVTVPRVWYFLKRV